MCAAPIGASRHERLDRRHAHHRRVADDVVHLLALEHGLGERQREPQSPAPVQALDRRMRSTRRARPRAHARGTRDRGRRNTRPRRPLRAAAPARDAWPRRRRALVRSAGSRRGAKKRGTHVTRVVDRSRAILATSRQSSESQPSIVNRNLRPLYCASDCSSEARSSANTRSSRRSAAADSAPSTSPQDTWIDKKVAIKVPHRQGLDFGELLREPRLLASVSHPNIVAITTAEKQDGRLLHRDGVRAGRDAREHHRRARARSS